MLERTFESAEKSQNAEKLILDMKHYYHVLTKEETEALFSDLEKVLARVLLLEVHNKKLRRKIAKRGTARKSSVMKDTSSRLELG